MFNTSDIQTAIILSDEPARRPGQRADSKPESPAEPRVPSSTDLYAAPVTRLPTVIYYLFVAAVLFMGWRFRDAEYLTAETGLGYNLGIAGGVVMLLLLLYPLRKKVRFMRSWGAPKYWFQAHMIMGILGPVMIMFHSNFRIGSMNSTVALVSMLLVAGSGFVGRHIYTKIHYGLYGRQMSLKELKKEIESRMNSAVHVLSYAPKLQQRLLDFDADVLRTRTSFVQSVWQFLLIGPRAQWTHLVLFLGLRRALKVTAKRAGWSAKERQLHKIEARSHISAHMNVAITIAEFNVYERLFALWHLFHLPLFFMLVIVAVVHVLAVHMY